MMSEEEKYVKAEYLAKILGISKPHVYTLKAEGVFTAEGTNRFPLEKNLLAYIALLKKRSLPDDDKKRILAADAKYKEYKAELMRMTVRKRCGELHEARHVKAIFSHNIIEIRTVMRAIPGRVANILANCAGPNEVATELKKAIDAALRSIADKKYDPDEFAALIEAEGEDTGVDDDDEGDSDSQERSRTV